MPAPSYASYARPIGVAILTAREARGLSQTALAALVNASQKAVSRWETGEVEPGLGALVRLAAALGGALAVDLGDGSEMVVRLSQNLSK